MVSPDLNLPDIEAIDADLSFLARRKAGFEQPEALMRGMQVLLSLDVVRRAAGKMEASQIARVAALRGVLRKVIDGCELDATRTAAGVLLFLLSPEELTEQGFDPELDQAPIGQRREAIAAHLGKGVGAFRTADEPRLCALVAGALLRYETEVRLLAAHSIGMPVEEAGPSGEDLDSRATSASLLRVLSGLYGNHRRLRPLVSSVIPDRPIYFDSGLSLRLTDVDDLMYRYELTFTFTAELDEYVVGYVTRSPLTDALLAGPHRLTDVYSFSNIEARDVCCAEVTNDLNVVTRITELPDGRTKHQPLRLVEVEESDYTLYLQDLGDIDLSVVTLLKADLPDSPSPHRLRLTQAFTLNKSDHFCYWVADRPIYLRHLRLDTSSFTPPASERAGRITLQPFMMATNAELALDERGQIDIETENWLLRGQGFTVVW